MLKICASVGDLPLHRQLGLNVLLKEADACQDADKLREALKAATIRTYLLEQTITLNTSELL